MVSDMVRKGETERCFRGINENVKQDKHQGELQVSDMNK